MWDSRNSWSKTFEKSLESPLLERAQVSDEISALLRIGHTGERHHVAWHRLLRIGDIRVKRLAVPSDPGALHRAAVMKPWEFARLSTEDSLQARSHADLSVDRMAGDALREHLLARGRVLSMGRSAQAEQARDGNGMERILCSFHASYVANWVPSLRYKRI